jgi:hypothetical protein
LKPNKFSYWFFNLTYKKANRHIVLGSLFKSRLINLNINPTNIIIESNAADDSYLINNIISERKNNEPFKLLFIARIEEKKEIMII